MVNARKTVSPLSLSRRWVHCLIILVVILAALPMITNRPVTVKASNLPNGFVETMLAQGLNRPSGMAIAPDGRVFVTLKSGKVMVIKSGILLSTPFVTVTTSTTGDLGLEGVAFDPNFNTNHYVYLYYTATTPTMHNRLSRFVANGDVADPNSETYLYESETLDPSSIMNVGGSILFGPDGKLYLTTGDAEVRANSQDLSNTLGKVLRMNMDGTIPTDNPFYTTLTGMSRLIYAYGLRNPFTADMQPGTGRFFADDVGDNTWEEIDDIKAGGNYGWPTYEGPSNATGFVTPLYYYGHGSTSTTGCAITGGTFYNPQTPQFPSSYVGTYFFQDYCSGWIRNYNPTTGQVTDFGSGLVYPVALHTGPDGSLYYVAQGSNTQSGVVYQIQYVIDQPPSIPQPVQDQRVSNGYPATFSVFPSGTSPFTYQWQRNDVNIPGATSSTYTLNPAQLSDSGANFRVIVTNAYGTVTSNEAKLTVITQQPPTASIDLPADGTMYNGGNTITYSGSATDPQDGVLPASAYTWEIRFQHNTHYHQFMAPTSGYKSSTFTTPIIGEPSANTWFRIVLTVTDSYGLSYTTYKDIHPHTANIALQTNPPGMQLSLDDTPAQAPIYFTGVVNFTRQISAPDVQRVNGQTWIFDRWSDGGADIHNINTPATDTTYIAYYHQQGPYQEQSGQLSMEAETYDNAVARNGQSWIFRNGLYGFSGTGYMLANPMQGTSYPTNYVGNSPEMQYQVNFMTPGLYYIWLRYNAPSSSTGAAVHLGLDGQAVSSAAQIKDPNPVVGDWGWTNKTIPGPVATINIPSAGMHTINVWMDQDGYRLDKIILTTDNTYVPDTMGLAESPRAAMATPTLAATTRPITATPTANGTLTPTATPNGTSTPTFVPATNTAMPTKTPLPATATPVQATNTPGPAGFEVQYMAHQLADPTQEPEPFLEIFNNSANTIPLSQLKLRYWFTKDGTRPIVYTCMYSDEHCSNITGTVTYLTTPVNGADTYIEIGFISTAPSLAPFSNTGQIEFLFHKDDWSNLTQSNDYSFDATHVNYADSTKITLYNNGVLVWGTEPSGAPAATSTATNTAISSATNTSIPATSTPMPPTLTKTNTPIPSATNTLIPSQVPSNTPLPPTATMIPATSTPMPPTMTKTNTPIPSATNTSVPTAVPTNTSVAIVPSNTPLPATATNTLMPTFTPSHTSSPMPTNTQASAATNTPMSVTNTAVPSAAPSNTPLPGATTTPGTSSTATNTASVPTNTPASSLAPTFTPTPTSTGIRVQYLAANTADTTNELDPYLKIVNGTSSSIPMSQLKIRYWFTRDSLRTMVFGCAYAAVKCANITGTFTYLSNPATNADTYLEVSFSSAAGSLPAFTDTGDMQLFLHNDIWSNFTQSNDYSFDATKTAYADFTHVTLYNNGVLVWGTEPGGIPTATPTSTPTNTPVPPTPNPSATPTMTNTPMPNTSGFKVQYMAGYTPDITNELAPYFKIFNNTSSSVPLTQIKLRYWFTRDTARPLIFGCAYAAVKCANITATFTSVTTPATTADTYMEVTFTSAAGNLPAFSDTGEIQTFIHKDDWSNFTQSNDYSFDATKTAYADSTSITLYNNGVLVWGTEPTTGSASVARDVLAMAYVGPATSTPVPTSTPSASSPSATPDGIDNPVDVALDKPALQSSMPKGAPASVVQASLAVDGNHDGSPRAASTSRTDVEANPWWQVDLGASYNIRAINVWNQTSPAATHLSKFYIFVSDAPFASTDVQTTLKQDGISAYYVDGQAGLPTNEMIRRTGRYVRVQLTTTDSLALAEVEVLGFPLPSDTTPDCSAIQTPLPPPANIALNKATSQSSDAKGTGHGQAGLAVDGNHNGDPSGNSLTQTGADQTAWWQVDLGTSENIRAINIWNRTDPAATHLSKFFIFVSDVPFTSTDLTATRQQPGVSAYYINGQAGTPTNQWVKRTGRYVRVQLTTTDSLSLAEVEVLGFPLPSADNPADCSGAPAPTATPTPTSTPTTTATPVDKPQA